MRRTLKEAEYAGGGAGGPLSELHAAAPGASSSAVASRTTGPLSIAVTCGTTSLKVLRRSAVTQFG
jgi:hypothetical protein